MSTPALEPVPNPPNLPQTNLANSGVTTILSTENYGAGGTIYNIGKYTDRNGKPIEMKYVGNPGSSICYYPGQCFTDNSNVLPSTGAPIALHKNPADAVLLSADKANVGLQATGYALARLSNKDEFKGPVYLAQVTTVMLSSLLQNCSTLNNYQVADACGNTPNRPLVSICAESVPSAAGGLALLGGADPFANDFNGRSRLLRNAGNLPHSRPFGFVRMLSAGGAFGYERVSAMGEMQNWRDDNLDQPYGTTEWENLLSNLKFKYEDTLQPYQGSNNAVSLEVGQSNRTVDGATLVTFGQLTKQFRVYSTSQPLVLDQEASPPLQFTLKTDNPPNSIAAGEANAFQVVARRSSGPGSYDTFGISTMPTNNGYDASFQAGGDAPIPATPHEWNFDIVFDVEAGLGVQVARAAADLPASEVSKPIPVELVVKYYDGQQQKNRELKITEQMSYGETQALRRIPVDSRIAVSVPDSRRTLDGRRFLARAGRIVDGACAKPVPNAAQEVFASDPTGNHWPQPVSVCGNPPTVNSVVSICPEDSHGQIDCNATGCIPVFPQEPGDLIKQSLSSIGQGSPYEPLLDCIASDNYPRLGASYITLTERNAFARDYSVAIDGDTYLGIKAASDLGNYQLCSDRGLRVTTPSDVKFPPTDPLAGHNVSLSSVNFRLLYFSDQAGTSKKIYVSDYYETSHPYELLHDGVVPNLDFPQATTAVRVIQAIQDLPTSAFITSKGTAAAYLTQAGKFVIAYVKNAFRTVTGGENPPICEEGINYSERLTIIDNPNLKITAPTSTYDNIFFFFTNTDVNTGQSYTYQNKEYFELAICSVPEVPTANSQIGAEYCCTVSSEGYRSRLGSPGLPTDQTYSPSNPTLPAFLAGDIATQKLLDNMRQGKTTRSTGLCAGIG